MIIKGILITMLAPMSDHIANAGEKLLGNASSIKRRPDGRVYISGQMQRHALFSALDRLNADDEGRGQTYVSNGDGVTNVVETDLRADLGGFLQTSKETYSGRRTAPVSATPAVALESSSIGRDLLIRLKMEAEGDSRGQAVATREFSQDDTMLMSFFVDVSAVGIRKRFSYEKELHVRTEYVRHTSEEERKRRIRLALEATAALTDYANQARNATSGEPQQVLLVFDTRLSRKASRYFKALAVEQRNILAELTARGAVYFLGDDTAENGDSTATAYQKAQDFLASNSLYDPAPGTTVQSTADFEKSIKPEKVAK
ncbi:MAG TPA: type I-PGING CRISPR-associated protein Cas7/Csp1 [Hymenobacter sp.]|jgi:CRISPR-associated protein Cst2|uniref:type I-PGING CRISPR-associated protein Cas7/Csp1 n=1 Tax=Hymenobacter sp. TaxID=1898978 RepID=UPI002EDACD96